MLLHRTGHRLAATGRHPFRRSTLNRPETAGPSGANTALAAAELSLFTENLNAQLAVLKLTRAAGELKPDEQ